LPLDRPDAALFRFSLDGFEFTESRPENLRPMLQFVFERSTRRFGGDRPKFPGRGVLNIDEPSFV